MKLQFTASPHRPGNTPDGTLSHLTNTKINLVRCLTNRATTIFSPRQLDEELDCIRKIFANNGYPPHVVNRTIRNGLNPRPRTTDSDSDVHFIYTKLPWIGDNRSEAFEKLIIQVTKPAYPTCRPRVCFVSKPAFPSCLKDALPIHDKSNAIYNFECRCGSRYIGKTIQWRPESNNTSLLTSWIQARKQRKRQRNRRKRRTNRNRRRKRRRKRNARHPTQQLASIWLQTLAASTHMTGSSLRS